MMLYLLLLPYGFAFLFFVSAVTKCLSLFDFKQAIVHFDVISRKYVAITSYLVIIMELALAVCFSQLVFLHAAFILTSLVMIFFIALFVRAIKQKKNFACSCFGVSTNKTNMKLAIFRNSILLVGAIWGICIANHVETLPYAQEHIMFYLISVAFLIHVYKELHILHNIQKKIRMIVP
nr:MauE/DoxX family redox-associated membrane protein [Brevibacillus laterosporus]